MAIREFGESLLADVRARKDQQVSDQRKEDRKAEKRALIGTAATWLGKEAIGAIRNNMEQKTSDFLYRTEAGATKVRMSKAATEIENAFALDAQAKTDDTSLEDVWGNKLADEIIAKSVATDPNYFMPGTTEEARSIYAQRDDVKSAAKIYADNTRFVMQEGRKFNAGKNYQTLDNMLNKSMGTGIISTTWKKLRGTRPDNIEILNEKINGMDQVIATNSILGRKIKLAKQFAREGDPDVAINLVNDFYRSFSTEEKTKYDAAVKMGEILTDRKTTITNVTDGYVTQTQSTWQTQVKGADGKPSIRSDVTSEFIEVTPELTEIEEANLLEKTGVITDSIEARALKGGNNLTVKRWGAYKKKIMEDKNLNAAQKLDKLAIASWYRHLWTTGEDIIVENKTLDAAQAKASVEELELINANIATAMGNVNGGMFKDQDLKDETERLANLREQKRDIILTGQELTQRGLKNLAEFSVDDLNRVGDNMVDPEGNEYPIETVSGVEQYTFVNGKKYKVIKSGT